MRFLFHIGRNNNLALAELLAVYGEKSIKKMVGGHIEIELESFAQSDLDKLGGVIAVYQVVERVVDADIDLQQHILDLVADSERTGKVTLNIVSNYLDDSSIRDSLKKIKVLLKGEKSIRYLENDTTAAKLGAGFLNGKLVEVLAYKYNEFNYVAKLIGLQNINSYSFRDFKKPYRDAKLGMLPPKLSQIMINLAGNTDGILYDPFCGTGTILMEGMLMGRAVQGSDLEEVNTKGTYNNTDWLRTKYDLKPKAKAKIFQKDATKLVESDLVGVTAVASEGYLGKPKRAVETDNDLMNELNDLGRMYYSFLASLAKGLKQPCNVVLCLPVYNKKGKNYFIENLVEKLPALGYSVSALLPELKGLGVDFKESLLYKRESQLVYRQIIRFTYTP
jgi:tRNA G10  N-methylase Trm11